MIDHLSFFQRLRSKWEGTRAKKSHKMKLRWQNKFWIIVVSVFQPNASHLTSNYFMVIDKRSQAGQLETVFISILSVLSIWVTYKGT